MNKTKYLSFLLVVGFVITSFASQIYRITLSELQAKADLVVLAKVIKVARDGNRDKVSIRVDSYLKGSRPQKDYTFTLVTRGGLKDFDPSLKKGDTGVFFLKSSKREGGVEKAFWGSVATFQKNYFDLTDEKRNSNKPDTGDGK